MRLRSSVSRALGEEIQEFDSTPLFEHLSVVNGAVSSVLLRSQHLRTPQMDWGLSSREGLQRLLG